MDPFSENDDAVLWAALESAHLKDHISSLEGQLNATVAQGNILFMNVETDTPSQPQSFIAHLPSRWRKLFRRTKAAHLPRSCLVT